MRATPLLMPGCETLYLRAFFELAPENNAGGMRIAAVSDLHGFLVTTPPSELLLVGGDVCPLDDESVDYQRRWLEGTFTEWLLRRPAQTIVGIAGNHEFV